MYFLKGLFLGLTFFVLLGCGSGSDVTAQNTSVTEENMTAEAEQNSTGRNCIQVITQQL
jgi:hypothetical protein